MVKATSLNHRRCESASVTQDGKVRKPYSAEQEEMHLYLSKLKELVPHMPKNRKVSKVEVINNVIDYICELQSSLLDQLQFNNNNLTTVVNSNVSADRQPLSSINTCAQEVNFLIKKKNYFPDY